MASPENTETDALPTPPLALERHTLEISDGRGGLPQRVRVVVWGAPLQSADVAVIYAGGTPSSAEEVGLHSLANGRKDMYAERGVCLIAMDKPGMGGTSYNPRFQIRRDYPRMVETVTERLGVGHFGIIGISNGGPWVMATLTDERLKDRVRAAAMVVAVGDVRASGYFSCRHPSGIFEGVFNSGPQAIVGPIIWTLTKCTRWFLFGWPQLYPRVAPARLASPAGAVVARRLFDDALANAGKGFALDCQQGQSPLYARPLKSTPGKEASADTAYRSIKTPVALWLGEKDPLMPVFAGEWMAERLQNSTLEVVKGAGHELYLDHGTAVLDDLLAKMRTTMPTKNKQQGWAFRWFHGPRGRVQ